MKRITLYLAALLFFTACEKKSECEKIDTSPLVTDQQATLENTKWKLEGFVDVEEGCLKRAKPWEDREKYYNYEKHYTLHFTDSVLFGVTTTNNFKATSDIDYTTYSIQIRLIFSTEVGEVGDGYQYCDILDEVQSFSLKNNELRLYYNNKKNYLLFKARQS